MRIKLAKQYFAVNPLWLCLTLTAFAILINLSWWQLSRASEKTEHLQRLAALHSAGALTPRQLATLESTEIDGAPLSGEARWLAPYSWLLDNQIVEGQVGYDVIVPVQAEGLNQLLLVNLGWVAGGHDRGQLPFIDIPEHIRLEGLLRTEVSGLMLLGQNVEETGSWPMRIQQVDYDELARISGLNLLPVLLYQQQNTEFISHYQPVVLPPEKHRGYALQWFLLAVAVIGVALAAAHQGRVQDEQI